MDINGSVAIVTGGSGGIGRATAVMLAGRGARVVLSARDTGRLAAAAAEIGACGLEVDTVAADVTAAADVDRLVAETLARHGRLDLLVHAAGAGMLKPVLDLTDEDFARQIAVNLTGAFLTLRRAASAMAAGGGGTIVAIPGVLGRAPMATAAAYCAAKYGLVGLAKAMAIDLKRANVRFSLLFLGGVDTPFWDSPDVTMKVRRDVMLTPEAAARAALFAAEQASPGVVGEVVVQPESHQLL